MGLSVEQRELLLERDIAVTAGRSAGFGVLAGVFDVNCIVSIDIESVMPTDAEVDQIVAYQDFVVHRFYRGPAVLDRRRPPQISGHNTAILIKGDAWHSNGAAGWAYRRITWSVGPSFFPWRDTVEPVAPPWSLLQVLDHINGVFPARSEADGSTWRAWKAEHHRIFPTHDTSNAPV